MSVGDRQNMREHGDNVKFCSYEKEDIYQTISNQIKHGKYPSSKIFGDGSAGARIAQEIFKLNYEPLKGITY